jgi:hypothetical protein
MYDVSSRHGVIVKTIRHMFASKVHFQFKYRIDFISLDSEAQLLTNKCINTKEMDRPVSLGSQN